jgi:hypothetical protein
MPALLAARADLLRGAQKNSPAHASLVAGYQVAAPGITSEGRSNQQEHGTEAD